MSVWSILRNQKAPWNVWWFPGSRAHWPMPKDPKVENIIEYPSNPSRSLGWWPEGVTPTAPVSEARYFHILPASPNMDIYFGADHFGPYPNIPNEDSRHSDGRSSKNHGGWFSPATPLIARDLALTAGVQVALVTKGGVQVLEEWQKTFMARGRKPIIQARCERHLSTASI